LLPLTAFRPYVAGDSLDSVVGRNTFFGDGLQTMDLGLYKNFVLSGAKSFSVRIEAFNLFNAVQYAYPAVNISTPGDVRNDHGPEWTLHSTHDPAGI
jgi:hypothetical protein